MIRLLLIVLLLAGCGAHGHLKAFDVPPTQAASLTVIRPSILGFAFRFPVFVDGHRVLGLGVMEHATILIPPGRRDISLRPGSRHTVTIDAKAGEHYYVIIENKVLHSDPVVVPAPYALEVMAGTEEVN